VKRDGSGTKGDAFCYGLPSLEEKLQTDPVAGLLQSALEAQRRIRSRSESFSTGAGLRASE
jgi:hypothetical protein